MPTAYVTAPRDVAPDIAERLVREELAACVNSVRCDSVYRWEGEVVDDEEVVLLAKTTADAYPALERRIEEIHPYEVPCIERFDEDRMLESFRTWRDESVDA